MRGQQILEGFKHLFETSDAKWRRKRRLLGYDDPSPTTSPKSPNDEDGIAGIFATIYLAVTVITGVAIFIGSWIYCIAAYGFLLGVGLGWLPSMIVAFLTAWLWPLALLIGVILVLVMLRSS